jgi:hypothetical protein
MEERVTSGAGGKTKAGSIILPANVLVPGEKPVFHAFKSIRLVNR